MSEISRVGKESGKLQHQFYQVTLPLQTDFDVPGKYFRLQSKPRSGFGGSVSTMNFRSQQLGGLQLQASNQAVKRITITAIEKGLPFLAVSERLNEFLNYMYIYYIYIMQTPGACVCFQAPTSTNIASSYIYGSEKNYLHQEESQTLSALQLLPAGKEFALPGQFVCKQSFLHLLQNFKLLSSSQYKTKSTDNVELGHKPSKNNTVLWGSHYPKTHIQPGTFCSFTLISSRYTAQEMTLIQQEDCLSLAACNSCQTVESKTCTNFAIKWK